MWHDYEHQRVLKGGAKQKEVSRNRYSVLLRLFLMLFYSFLLEPRKGEKMEENKEYELVNLEIEYPGIQGGVKWAVITDLPEELIKERYEEELKKYWPYIVLPVEQGAAFKDFHRNEHKHEMRSIRHHDALDFQDEIPFVQGYGNLVGRKSKAKLEEEGIVDHVLLKYALAQLSDKQRRRCYMYFFCDMGEEEIARIEGVSHQAVHDTLSSAVRLLRKVISE